MSGKQDVANLLSEIRKKLIKICVYLQKEYPDDKRMIRTINRFTQIIFMKIMLRW